MALFNLIRPKLQIQPPPTLGTIAVIKHDSQALQILGFNMQIQITEVLPIDSKLVAKSVAVIGHFDTGARATSIDIKLAELLGLTPVGSSIIRTANGEVETPNYIASMPFPNTALKSFEKIPIGSCN